MTNTTKHTADYTLTMRDIEGTTITLHISGALIDKMVENGYSHDFASEIAESDEFYKAVNAAQIRLNAWVVTEADA